MNNQESTTKAYIKPASLPKYGSLATAVRYISPGQVVLDVGCAEGYLAHYLPKNEVWGIDGNTAAVAKAKKVCIAAKVIDLNKLPDKPVFNQRFDVIVFADVLEHLLFPEENLKHFKQYLKPGGKIIVSVPNIALWRVRCNLLLGRFDYTDYGVMDRTHLHLYTFKSSQELLVASNYKLRNVHGAANLLGPVITYLPFLKKMLSIHIILVATA